MHIEFNGHSLEPIPGSLKLCINREGRLDFSPQAKELAALRYLWQRIGKGRDYVCLARMSRDTGFSYDDCERLVAQAHVDRKIPRLVITEDVTE